MPAPLTKIRKALRVAGNLTVLGSTVFGSGGSAVKGIVAGTLSCIIGTAAGTSTTSINTAVAGIGAQDRVYGHFPAGLNDDLVFDGLSIPAAGSIQASFYNPTTGGIAGGTVNIPYIWYKLT